MLVLMGYIGAFVVLSSYWISVHRDRPELFHLGNVIGSILMVGGLIAAGVWYSVVVTSTFGLLGAYGLLKKVNSPPDEVQI